MSSKVSQSPGTVLSPVPAVMVSCAGLSGKPNIITLAWVGTVCSDPPMVGISIRPSRYSHGLIDETGDFVINLPLRTQLEAMDYCGVVSGRDVDKFTTTGLTPISAELVKSPLIAECPVNMECRVRQSISLGSHDLFIAEILRVHRSSEENLDFLTQGVAYGNGKYLSLDQPIGTYGFAKNHFGDKA